MQVVILGSPNDPESSKHVVSACVELLSWNKKVSNAISYAAGCSGAPISKALCALHHGPVSLQYDALGGPGLSDSQQQLMVTGPAMRQLRIHLAGGRPGHITAARGIRRVLCDLGHKALLCRPSATAVGFSALHEGACCSAASEPGVL
jgi:hypothetical protein